MFRDMAPKQTVKVLFPLSLGIVQLASGVRPWLPWALFKVSFWEKGGQIIK